MNKEIKDYIRVEAIIGAAFNFFINGMIAALIYHNADAVPTNIVSIAIDLLSTCLLTFIISSLFIRSSLKSTKTLGILPNGGGLFRLLGRLYRTPVLFGIVMGFIFAVIFYIPTALIFFMSGITVLPFFIYIVLKCVFSALLGAGATILEMLAGMCDVRNENKNA